MIICFGGLYETWILDPLILVTYQVVVSIVIEPKSAYQSAVLKDIIGNLLVSATTSLPSRFSCANIQISQYLGKGSIIRFFFSFSIIGSHGFVFSTNPFI